MIGNLPIVILSICGFQSAADVHDGSADATGHVET